MLSRFTSPSARCLLKTRNNARFCVATKFFTSTPIATNDDFSEADEWLKEFDKEFDQESSQTLSNNKELDNWDFLPEKSTSTQNRKEHSLNGSFKNSNSLEFRDIRGRSPRSRGQNNFDDFNSDRFHQPRRNGANFVRERRSRNEFDEEEQDDPFARLQEIDWKGTELVPFTKDFYQEHAEVTNMSKDEVLRFMKEHEVSVFGDDVPNPIQKFEHMNFPEYINDGLSREKFDSPTEVQCFGWPIAMSGGDMVGIAKTGSGKTLGFLLPAIVHINAQEVLRPGDGPIALVLSPTRELTMQTLRECQRFGRTTQLKSCAVYGGAGRAPQIRALQSGCEIVVATPGRLLDFLDSGITNLERVTYLVLDEADRMLDMGFEQQIRKIVSQVRPDRQTTFWTATWPKEIQQLAKTFSPNPTQLRIGSLDVSANSDVDQTVEIISSSAKPKAFVNLVREESQLPGRILIFVATKRTADRITQGLRAGGIDALSLHGDKSQSERDWVMSQFRSGRASILVATDIASRGLDIKDIKLVVNYDMPAMIEDYVHRIGRTARAGKSGRSHSFFTEDDRKIAGPLVEVLERAKQDVPARLHSFINPRNGRDRQYLRKRPQRGGFSRKVRLKKDRGSGANAIPLGRQTGNLRF